MFIQAVEAFKNHHGHLQIPKDVVPRQADIFPACTWGLKIGSKSQNVIYRGDFGMGMRGKFHEMGLRISKKGFDTRHWDYIYSALQIYKSVYGDVQVGLPRLLLRNSYKLFAYLLPIQNFLTNLLTHCTMYHLLLFIVAL